MEVTLCYQVTQVLIYIFCRFPTDWCTMYCNAFSFISTVLTIVKTKWPLLGEVLILYRWMLLFCMPHSPPQLVAAIFYASLFIAVYCGTGYSCWWVNNIFLPYWYALHNLLSICFKISQMDICRRQLSSLANFTIILEHRFRCLPSEFITF